MRKFTIITIVCILVLILSLSVACTKQQVDASGVIDFKTLKAVDGLSAYDLYKEIEKTYHEDNAYHRQDYFSFSANEGALASQQSVFEAYRDGDKYFSRNLVLGTGAGSRHDMTSIYNDGTTIFYNKIDSGSKIKRNKECDDPFVKDYYTVVKDDYGTFEKLTDYNASAKAEDKIDADEEFKHNYQHITTYDTSKKEYLSKDHDDTVYDLGDDQIAFVLTIDCALDKLSSTQTAARDEFLASTGAKAEGFSMLEDTTIQITAKKIDGKYKLTGWIRTEQYEGKHTTGIMVKCYQQSKCIITYDDYTLSNDIIKTAIPN